MGHIYFVANVPQTRILRHEVRVSLSFKINIAEEIFRRGFPQL